MHIQNIADSMSGAVFIVQMLLPEILSRQNIQIPSGGALQKFCLRKPEHRRGHKGEYPLLLRCNVPEYDRPGHIRGPANVLTSGVN